MEGIAALEGERDEEGSFVRLLWRERFHLAAINEKVREEEREETSALCTIIKPAIHPQSGASTRAWKKVQHPGRFTGSLDHLRPILDEGIRCQLEARLIETDSPNLLNARPRLASAGRS